MPVLQNCQCNMSSKNVKLCLPVIGSMPDIRPIDYIKPVAFRHDYKNCDNEYNFENAIIRIRN